ncbi:antibiotic biosynthesis monooxygenase [Streptomyces sp. NPDC046727]|uniref:antibiotic biosynthesis monooxygenase n=1 Tax=Streptomyces sp. NPDC046727 TaxID=3155373 RepID=UPI003407B0A8
MTEAQKVPDVRKTVTVDVPADRAFAIFAERPLEWFPEKHVFVENRVSLTIEPFEGGRYYEVGADGTEIAWGTVVEWNPPKRIVLTWRVGPHWQPIFDDEKASFIEVDFEALGPGRTTVALTHSGLHRHGEIAPLIHAALDGPSPGETLARYEQVVARVSAAASAAPAAPVTLVNKFQVTGSTEEFEAIFAATSAFFAAQPGFIEHTLHRRLDEPTAYVNIARWTDNASLRAAVAQPEFQPHSAALRALAVSSPELFEARLSVRAADAE